MAVGNGNGTGGTATQPAQSLVSGMGGANWGTSGGGSTDSLQVLVEQLVHQVMQELFPTLELIMLDQHLQHQHILISQHLEITAKLKVGTSGNAGANGAFYGAGGGGADTTLSGGSGIKELLFSDG